MMGPSIKHADASRPRGVPGLVRSCVRGAAAALLAVYVASSTGLCQSEWQVDVLIPDTISVRMPTQEIAFGITHADYPPPSFPARYRATRPEGGVLRLEVFSSAASGWSLLLEIPDLLGAVGRGAIPADQVLYRVDDGLWTRASPVPQVIFTSVGPTDGWLELAIAFELELVGNEVPGSFSATTRLSAVSEGQGP